jgi:hypothetical protein
MKTINKRRLFYCLVISIILNGVFYFQQLQEFKLFSKQGIIKELYIKSVANNETSFFQKVKYTKVAETYFVTAKGDTIYNIGKNIWAMQVDALDELNFYLPLDSVIYDNHNPKDYQLISEFRNYSKTYNVIIFFLIGPLIFTVWFYFMTIIIEKGITRLRESKV